jgi:hypothetical protein
MCAITQSSELFSHATSDEVASVPLNTTKASRENLFSQPSTQDASDAVGRPETLPRNPFQAN